MITFKPLSTPFARQAEDEVVGGDDAADGVSVVKVEEGTLITGQERSNAYAFLLELDDVRILIDCGAPEDMAFPPPLASDQGSSILPSDPNAIRPLDEILEDIASSIDLVLLSHSTLPHVGLFAYARARLGLRCPVYASLPVQAMGRLTVLEAVENIRAERNIEKENKRDVVIPRRTEPVLSLSAIATAEEEEEEQHAARLAAQAAIDDLNREDGSLAAEQPRVLCLPTPIEVDEAFEEITTLRYQQPTQLDGKCIGLTLTAYSAGHSLGGTVWKLRSATSGTILIALDWNHNQERHLDATAMLAASGAAAPMTGDGARPAAPSSSGGILEAVKRPDLLITGVGRGLIRNAKRKDRDAAIIDIIHKSVQSGHSVLLPIDPSARLLEVLVLLHQHWTYAYPSQGGPDRVPLCLVSRTGREVIERARAFMEWMRREWATKAAEPEQQAGRRGGRHSDKNQVPTSPLEFSRLRVFATLAAMDAAIPPDAPRVVLACPPSLSHGPSRELLARFSSRPEDVVLLTQRGDPGSLARHLWEEWNRRQSSGTLWAEGKVGQPKKLDGSWSIELRSRIALEGEELEIYRSAERASREKAAAQRAKAARSRRMLEADEDEESDSDGDSDGSSVADGRAKDFAEAGDDGLGRRKRGRGVAFEEDEARDADGTGLGDEGSQLSFDIYLKGNASRATSFFGARSAVGAGGGGNSLAAQLGVGARYRMFPLVERKRRFDAYGEVVDVARWKNKKGDENEGWVGSAVALPPGAARGPLTGRQPVKHEGLGGDDEEDEDIALGIARKRRKTDEAERSVPSRFLVNNVSLDLSCSVQYVDMSGLNDDRALSIVLPQLAPRRLILVDGPAKTRRAVSASLAAVHNSSMTSAADIHAPAIMQSVSIGELTSAFSVTLGEGLLASLDLSPFEDYQVALLRAAVRVSAESTVPTLEIIDGDVDDSESHDNKEDIKKVIDAAAAGVYDDAQDSSVAPIPHVPSTLYIGDLKLTSLKTALASASRGRIPSDFAGEGVLVCGSAASAAGSGTSAASATTTPSVRVQKLASGRLALEGNVGAGYFAVRDAIYALHARVVGQSGP